MSLSVPAVGSLAATGGAQRVLAIAGSLRRASFNLGLLEAAAELAPPPLRIEVVRDLAAIPMFDEDFEQVTAGGSEPVRALRRRLAAADGLLVATPEYNQSFPGVLKNAVDWLSRPGPEELLAGKPVAIVGATAGPWGTRLAQAGLRQVLAATEASVLPTPALYVRHAAKLFDAAGRLVDGPTRARLRALLEAFSGWMARVAPRPEREGVDPLRR